MGSADKSHASYLPLLALAALVAFTDLGGRSVHDMDVPRSAGLAREMLASGEWLVPLRGGEVYANKPPLYVWLVAGPSWVLGDVTPFTARLPAALAFIGLVLACSWWGRMRTGSAAIGHAAALLVLSTFFMVFLAREARLDMLAAALAVGATALLDGAAHGRGVRRGALWAGLLLGFGLLTKGPLVLALPAAVLVLGGEPGTPLRARLRRSGALPALGIAALVALAWFVPAVLYAGGDYARTLLLDQATSRIGGTSTHIEPAGYYPLHFALTAAPWGLFYLGVMLASAWPRTARALGPAAGLARAALVLVVLYSLVPTKHMRYLAPVIPLPAIVLAAWASARLAGAALGRRRVLVAGAVTLAAGGVAVVVACARSEVGGWAAVVPGAGMLLLAIWIWRRRADPAAFVTAVLLSAVCALSALSVLRYRFRIPSRVQFNRALAAALQGRDRHAMTVEPVYPEDVFLGAPNARHVGLPAEAARAPPPPGAVFVCWTDLLDELEAAYGRSARVVVAPERRKDGYVAVTFEEP